MPSLTHCPLTGIQLDAPVPLKIVDFDGYDYSSIYVGHVKIGIHVINHLDQYSDKLFIIAGICRNRFENGESPIIISTHFIDYELDKYQYPHTFVEQRLHLLNYIFKKSGPERNPINVNSSRDYPIAFCKTQDAFSRLMVNLYDTGLIKIYDDKIVLSDDGELTIRKYGLILNFNLESGEKKIDDLFAHSQELFYKYNSFMEDKRSACLDLAGIIEGIRDDLNKCFADHDINFLFEIINKYNIRHNKGRVQEIKFVEQIEWIYYSLKLTIITYYRLKQGKPHLFRQ